MRIEIGANEAGQRTDKFMRKVLGDVPLSKIYKAFRKGDIRVNGSKIKEKHSLVEGDIVETKYITSEFKRDEFVRIDNKLKITFEDANILMVEKWPGVLVHADKKDGEPTLTDYALSYLFDKGDYKPENEITFTPAPCNRLDRNTSGMVIFGKNFKSLKLLNEMIRDRNIEKYYMALVSGRIKDGIYEGYIYKNEDANISQVFKEPKPDTKRIAMDVKTIESCGTFSLLDINLLTGRSHQLRAHLSMLGNPILGDPKYGNKKINSFFNNKYGLDSQYLYAYKLIFKNCPEDLSYMENKTIAESLPPALKKIKRDIFKF
ncbi:RluA family pseudouridine synthase [Clostridium estertheticum]|uniref:RNA pseudouridylate synthase n=2 Tax=Clostridium estertheticum TaxID=238834 RepID=A0A1J0GJ47_9CLOT|nr:RluA family pseudouridine synthase [Clostridium estertheticum]APC41426.1 pseudouridine synthase [Clostridium estertheticum subsp. estertheticum]MBU3072890.1 RluA family pseudouridine synthase [Clostridium estertheticum]MBU3163073.1 RluA family pseudouridine synthase [Clostridium estertheticum]MBU3172689.1 RluA family pseudouridine synthase [Clostridium estertheticum]MBW9169777.1 RluA family pseudouridine synthase [Clostridium estertheticum]